MSRDDLTNLAYWFPKLETIKDGLRLPETRIITTDANLTELLDGQTPDGYDQLVKEIRHAALEIGYPAFLRTGHTSGKHEWSRTCELTYATDVGAHVCALVEHSVNADMFGLPTQDWVVREMIPTAPLFVCEGYGGFPVVREFRVFIRDGVVEHIQPYWPEDAVEQGRPPVEGWREILARASRLEKTEVELLCFLAGMASMALDGGYWSVDFLQAADGYWWLTDMAEGDKSFRWEPRDA